MTLHRSLRLAVVTAALASIAMGTVACNMIDAALGHHAHLSDMVPGQSVLGGDLQCWLTMEFDQLPEGIDHRDVVVRFTSVALERPVEFDWQYISTHDVLVPQGNQAFGSGHQRNEASTPSQPPPTGMAFKAKFTLPARETIENAPDTLWLHAELYWGGEEQDSVKRTIEHVYESSAGSFF